MQRFAGRPDLRMSEELDTLILETASRLFGEQGYAATSVEQIAAAAQVGKQTIYRRHSSKENLFKRVIFELGNSFLATAEPLEELASSDPLLALYRTLRMLLDLVLAPETLALSRTFIAEGWRFPDLVNHAGAHIFESLENLTSRFLGSVEEAGLLNGPYHLEETGQMLCGLTLGIPHQKMLFGRGKFETKTERDHYFNGAWVTFMNGILASPLPGQFKGAFQ